MTPEELAELEKSNPKAHAAIMKARDEEKKAKDDLESERKKKDSKKKGKEDDEDDEDDDNEDDDDKDGDDDLRKKARKEKESDEGRKSETKKIEKALSFNIGVAKFVETNTDLLPSEIQEILKVAEKEKYDSALDKASALKRSMVEAFFTVQSNLDLLTTGQKAQLDEYLKLTKNGKESKAEFVYENLFEPALETLRKVKKAEEVGKSRAGFGTSSKVEDQYRDRLIKTSKKTHLGEKGA